MEPVSRRPSRATGAAGVLAGLVTVGAAGYYSWGALGLGSVGLFLLVVGLVGARHRIVTGGAAALVLGAFFSGIAGAPAVPLLLAVTTAVIAWDFANAAISFGEQLGTAASTIRLEATHMASTGFVGVAVAGLGYTLFQVGTGRQPIAALVLLVVAAVLLVEAVR